MMIHVPDQRIVFKEKGKKVETVENNVGHIVVNLELVGKWEDSEAIYLVEKEDDVQIEKGIKKINKTLNKKGKIQLIYAYKNAGKLDEGIRKKINEIVDKYIIYKKNSNSKPKPAVVIPKATIAIDLKHYAIIFLILVILSA